MPAPVHVDPAANAVNDAASDASSSEVDMVAVMTEMTVAERRRIYALQGLLKEYYEVRQRMRAEIAALANECAAENQKLFAARMAIVTGERDITSEEMQRIGVTAPAAEEPKKAAAAAPGKKGVKIVDPVDEKQNSALLKAAASPSGGIPSFWMTAMSNSEAVNGMITEKDREALTYVTDIEREFVEGDPEKGDRLVFHFAPNNFFTNATLTKEYHTEYDEDHGEPRITDVVGCDIDWKSSKANLTVTVKQKKQRNKKTGQMRVVEREEQCESFFNFFSPPNPDDDEDDEDNEEEDFLEQEMEMDVEVGTALTQMVVPRAIYYYTGEAVVDTGKELREQFGFGDEEDDEEEEDEEDDDDDDDDEAAGGASNFRNIVRQRGGRGGAPAGGRGRGAAGQQPPQQQECKQQ